MYRIVLDEGESKAWFNLRETIHLDGDYPAFTEYATLCRRVRDYHPSGKVYLYESTPKHPYILLSTYTVPQ